MDRDQIALWDVEAVTFDDDPDHGLRDPRVRGAWSRLFSDLLPPVPARIADLGCGTGTLTAMLASDGYAVDGVDFSPEMVRRAAVKAAGVTGATILRGDAADPPLESTAYDVVLCRHVLWALPRPADALARWRELLRPTGRLVLIEGSWSTGAGLTGAQTLELVKGAGFSAALTQLDDPVYWGRETGDERYVVVARHGPGLRR